MRIDAYNQVAKVYQASQVNKTSVSKSKRAGELDSLVLSQTGKDLQVAKEAVKSAPDIREDRVAELKAKIQSGEYNVSAEDFADKLVEKYMTKLF
ncbi:MAG: flagellar biosynthesis anti-sigma factor FlgM [Lachnospiraceae bacterium]|nr:flagellar biosynthesis anti-sigma factor FlgM [Lachnospiraceae bacterium]